MKIADLFDYPTEKFIGKVLVVQALIDKDNPQISSLLSPFTKTICKLEIHELEELFTRSFDVQAATTLDIGYVLFGDDYKRGKLLAHLNKEHEMAENNCGFELADHLPNILKLLPKLKDQELASELVSEILAPALQKMIAEFDQQVLQKKNEAYLKHYKTLIDDTIELRTIYKYPLEVVYQLLKLEFNLTDAVPLTESQSDFLGSIGTEISIEENHCQH